MSAAARETAYGVLGLKTHAKTTLIVRREDGGLRRYVHLATGNYNPATSTIYTDLGLLTADVEIGAYAMLALRARSCTLVSSAALTLGNRHAEP